MRSIPSPNQKPTRHGAQYGPRPSALALLLVLLWPNLALASRLIGLSGVASDPLSAAAACAALGSSARVCSSADLNSLTSVTGLPDGPWSASFQYAPLAVTRFDYPLGIDALGMTMAGSPGRCSLAQRFADGAFRISTAPCAEQPALCCAGSGDPLFVNGFEDHSP